MCSLYIKIILFSLLFLFSCVKKDDTWETIAIGLPDQISPKVAMLNMGYYLLKQTHEPILRENTEGKFESKILSKWSRSIDSKFYRLCLKDNLIFLKNINYTHEIFFKDISRIAKEYDSSVKLSLVENCTKIVFKRDSYSFLNTLSDYKNAPTYKLNDTIHHGLGDYFVTFLGTEKAILKRKNKTSSGYNKIVFYSHKSVKDTIFKNKNIEDFNRVLLSNIPSWVTDNYNSYPVSLLQTISLVLNIKDKNDKSIIYNCIDIEMFRKAYFPKRMYFSDVRTILPIGFMGAEKGRITQNCKIEKKRKSKYIFYNWNQDNTVELKEYFIGFYNKTGIKFTIKNVTPSEIINMGFLQPHPYDMIVAAFDAVSENIRAFYSPLVDKKQRLIDDFHEKGQLLLSKINMTRNKKQKLLHINKFNMFLKNEKIVVPLFQEVRNFYYPKRIKNLKLGEDGLEYLRIGEIEL